MANVANLSLRIGTGIGALVLLIFAWPFSIPGMVLAIFWRGEIPAYVRGALALLVVVGLRLAAGEWMVEIGGVSAGHWYEELFLCIFAWALGTILLSISFQVATITFDRRQQEPAVSDP